MLRSQSIGRAMYNPSLFLDKEEEISGISSWGLENRKYKRHGQGGNRHANRAIALRDK